MKTDTEDKLVDADLFQQPHLRGQVARALERGELDRAERAARTALEAMPYAEVPRVDLTRVLELRGSKDAAERLFREEVCNRDDDGSGPLDLSDRTEQIRRRREWLSAS